MNLLKNLVGVLGLLWLLAQWFPSKPTSEPVVAAKPFFTNEECVEIFQQRAVKHSPEVVAMIEQKMRSRGLCAEK